MITLRAEVHSFAIEGEFRIARGTKTRAETVRVTLGDGSFSGRGEAVPYARYGETVEGVLTRLRAIDDPLRALDDLPAGAARNVLDCALVDLECKRRGMAAHRLLDLDMPAPTRTAQTLSLGSPEAMAKAANKLPERALIKVKLGGEGDIDRLQAIRDARPEATLILDANEGWSCADYHRIIPHCQALGAAMIEQPFAADNDEALRKLERPIPIYADESVHIAGDLPALASKYDGINIKLDKAGGIRPAIALRQAAIAAGMPYMIGCMVGSSLAMAPATLLMDGAAFVDLDGPLFLAEDVAPAIAYRAGMLYPPDSNLWG